LLFWLIINLSNLVDDYNYDEKEKDDEK